MVTANHKDAVVQLDRRVALVENKLSVQDINARIHVNNNTQEIDIETKCGKIAVAENAIVIHNLAYQQKDAEDVNKLLSRGLNLGMKAKTVHRAPSRYHFAGVLNVEMHSLDDKVATLKRRAMITNSNQFDNVVIESFKTPTHVLIEKKLIH